MFRDIWDFICDVFFAIPMMICFMVVYGVILAIGLTVFWTTFYGILHLLSIV